MTAQVRWCRAVAGALWLAACGSVQGIHRDGGTDSDGSDDGPADGPADGPGDGPGTDAPPPGELASCIGLPATCGAGSADSCCNSPAVIGGTYHRSFDLAGNNSGATAFPATISDFRLDKYEVTVGRFRRFVDAGMGTQAKPPPPRAGAHPNLAGSGWDTSWNLSLPADRAALLSRLNCNQALQMWTDAPGAGESRPMNCLDWFEAMAFCAWDGGYLPTEAEWNYAAAGGDQQRAFPWSVPAGSLLLDPQHASYYDGTNCVGDGLPDCLAGDVLAVGSRPDGDGRWGQSDLSGNLAEWVLDWGAAYALPCVDCANLTPSAAREIRGGSFAIGAGFLRSGFRLGLAPSTGSEVTGVRCARPASQPVR